jgi:hypothetical protein
MALGLTQHLTEMSTSNISWGKGGRCVGLTTLHFHVPIVLKSGCLNLLEPSGTVQACNGIALPLPLPLPTACHISFLLQRLVGCCLGAHSLSLLFEPEETRECTLWVKSWVIEREIICNS